MSAIDRRGLSVDPTNAIKAPCRAATTTNITLNGLQTIDGVALAEGDRALVWLQTDATQNGPYNASSGNWTRTLDADSNDEWVNGCLVQVVSGPGVYAGLLFRCTATDPITIDTTSIAFSSSFVTSSGGAVTDNALARFDGVSGAILQGSVVLLSDVGVMSGLTGLTLTVTNPTILSTDYGFATSKKAALISVTVSGTGSGVGAGGTAQMRVLSTATDVAGAAAWTMQTRIEAANESYAAAAIMDNQNASAVGAAFAAILRNGVGNTAYDDSPGSVAGMNGIISFSEQDIGQGQNAYVATNSITATNRWHVAFKAINPSDAVVRADQFGSAAVLDFRRLNGAPPSSTGLLTNDVIYAINGYGWGTNTGSTAPRVGIEARASQNWTDAAQGSSAFVRATRAGTITTNDVVKFGGDIPLSVLQITGDNAGQSLRLVPAYDATKFWDIWTGTSGGLTFSDSVANQLGIDAAGTLFPTGFIDLANGRVLATNIVAPATPAAGRSSIYVDSTTLALVNKDGNGNVHTTVSADAGAANNFLTGITAAGAITKAQPAFTNISGTATAAQGGTGQSSYTTGDLLYASGAAALSKLADVATGNALISGGVGVAPSWGKIGLTTHISGILGAANGGFAADISAQSGVPLFAAGVATFTSTSGSGNFVRVTSATLVTPTLGAASATSINGLTITSSTGVLTVTNAKTLSVSNTLTLTGTDGSSVAFGTGGTVAYTANNLSVFAATTSAQLAGVISDETGSGALVFANTPTLVTPEIGLATGKSLVLAQTAAGVPTVGLTVKTFDATGSSVAAMAFVDNTNAVFMYQFSDASSKTFRFKSGGSVNFHTGNVAVSAAGLAMSLDTSGNCGVTGAITTSNATAIPAGGTAGIGQMFSSTANFGTFFGSGAPTLSAAKGSLYLRNNGTTTNDRAYINTDGGTTWTALTTAA